MGKVFERVLDERIRPETKEMVVKEAQGGFRKDRRCVDQIFVLKRVVELRKKRRLKRVLAFFMVLAGSSRKEKRMWWLGEKEMGETTEYKYLGVWVDAKLKGNVHLEKKVGTAE